MGFYHFLKSRYRGTRPVIKDSTTKELIMSKRMSKEKGPVLIVLNTSVSGYYIKYSTAYIRKKERTFALNFMNSDLMRAYFTSFIVLFEKGHGKDWFKYLCPRQYKRSWYDPVKSSSHPYQMNPFIHDDCLCLFFGKSCFLCFHCYVII